MNNKNNIKRAHWMLVLLTTLIFTACSEWTEIESVTINESDIAKQNPELYAEYLENLREYKESEHKITIAWFDNSNKTPLSRAHHIEVIPDSIDIVSIQYPVDPAQHELDEMEKVRNNKGTKFVYDMNFESIKLIYETMVAELEEKASKDENAIPAETPTFIEFLVDTVNIILPLAETYNYDGVIVGYKGKNTLYMTEAEKAQYSAYEKAFIGIALDWQERNSDKMILFEGLPQNVLNKILLEKCKYIIIPSSDAGNGSKLNYNILTSVVVGVPDDRFIVSVETVTLDKEDVKTGYWADGITRSVIGAAQWIASKHTGYNVAGLGIKNVNNDYFNIARIYPNTRDAISLMNPSPKK